MMLFSTMSTGSKSTRLTALQALRSLLLAVMLSALTACSPYQPPTPPPSVQNLPLYPGAHQVQVQNVGGVKGVTAKKTTFATSAGPDAVMAFYDELLFKDG